MNTYTGSLQRKGRRYYLVVTAGGRQKWISLKTQNLRLARRRAALVAPQDAADETAWLVQLVRLGNAARQRLDRKAARASVPWRRLWEAFRRSAAAPLPAASAATYRRWLEILADAAPPRRAPNALTANDARRVMDALAARYVSAPRFAVFYRRVWRALGWDPAVWPSGRDLARAAADGESGLTREFYRRLETDEVRRVVRHLAARPGDALAQAYADMVRIGFSTGLRLSDVAKLTRDEVVADGAFLSLVPNKTRRSKSRPLRIPLVCEAQACVRRRMAAEGGGDNGRIGDAPLPQVDVGNGGNSGRGATMVGAHLRCARTDGAFLFPEAARRRPSKAIGRAFRACGVMKRGDGRASFHSLRATFISLMDEAGVPPHVTDAITGHAGGGMHARYTQPSDAALAAAVERAIPKL